MSLLLRNIKLFARTHCPRITAWLTPYARLVRLDRPIGILLLLWPTLTALWIAAGIDEPAATPVLPPWHLLLIFTAGVFIMRSAGCCINDFADAKFDGEVARTRTRPLATGHLSRAKAFLCFLLLSAVGFLLVLLTNRHTIMLSFGAVAAAAVYPFMKRFTHLPQVALGIAFSWGIPMAFTAVQDVSATAIPPLAWLLFTANVLWTVAYDTQYAMVDRSDDEKLGLKSTAILFGPMDRPIIAALQSMFLAALWLSGRQLGLGTPFNIALLIAAMLFVYQHYLIRHRLPTPCFKAFQNNNWVGLTIFLGTAASYSGISL